MSLAEKEIYAVELELKLEKRLAAIAYFNECVLIEIAATLALNQFQKKYTRVMINRSTLLQEEEDRLIAAKTKAWNDRFVAESEAYPPTLESILWIVAKSGFTKEVAPLMNLSKATRECKNLQRYMREVRNWPRWGGKTQLFYFCEHGMTSSVVRMLEMRSIDVEARVGGSRYGWTCLQTASFNGHLSICRLLLDKGSQLEAKDSTGWTPLLYAASHGHVEIVRLLCDRGADIEARDNDGDRPLHSAACTGHITVVKELIEERNAEINARSGNRSTALRMARRYDKEDVAAYLVSHGGIDGGGRAARAPRGDGEEREEMPPPMCASTLTRMSRPHLRPVVTFSAPCATGLKSAAEVEPKAAHPVVSVGFGLQRIAIDIFPSSGGVADFSSGEYNREVWR